MRQLWIGLLASSLQGDPIQELEHGLGRSDQADTVIRQGIAIADCPQESPININRAAAHSAGNSTHLINDIPTQPHQDQVRRRWALRHHTEDLHCKLLNLSSLDYRLAHAHKARHHLVQWEHFQGVTPGRKH